MSALNSPVGVAVAGAAGRMGRALIEGILKHPGMQLTAAFDARGSAAIGSYATSEVGSASKILVGDDAAAAIGVSNCLIDFTKPEATIFHASLAVAHGSSMVIGTTGFTSEQKQKIVDASRQIPIVMAANFAVGVNVVFKLAEVAARSLGADFDVEIIEAHHKHKVDSPSGTALRLGEVVAGALGRNLYASAVFGREGITGERAADSIAFHSIRGGDIVGEHTVLFAGDGERVEVTVRSQSRMTYALGALRAVSYVQNCKPGLYDMQDVLGLR